MDLRWLAWLAALASAAGLIVHLRPRAPTWRRRAAAAALGLCFAIGAYEALSVLWPEQRYETTTWWNHDVDAAHRWAFDPMINRLNPWFVDMRFKGREFTPAHPDRTRVILFGGSQTFGWGVPTDSRRTFADLLEPRLAALGHGDVEVLNAAFPGVRTTTGLRWYRGLMRRFDPDVVVINFVVNEYLDVDPYRVWAGARSAGARVAPLAALASLRRAWPDLQAMHMVQTVAAMRYDVGDMERSLRAFIDEARRDGAAVVLSIEPTNLAVESSGRVWMQGETSPGEAAAVYRRLGEATGAPVFDATAHLGREPESLLFYDTMHLSLRGHALFAEALARLLADEVLHAARDQPL